MLLGTHMDMRCILNVLLLLFLLLLLIYVINDRSILIMIIIIWLGIHSDISSDSEYIRFLYFPCIHWQPIFQTTNALSAHTQDKPVLVSQRIPSHIIIVIIWFFLCYTWWRALHEWLAALSSHYQSLLHLGRYWLHQATNLWVRDVYQA